MRPRPDAAENPGISPLATPSCIASMRPRPDAAENAVVEVDWGTWKPGASMRPRPDAAENPDRERKVVRRYFLLQ